MNGRVQMGTLKTGMLLCQVSFIGALIVALSIRWLFLLLPCAPHDPSSSYGWCPRGRHTGRREESGSYTNAFATSNICSEWIRRPAWEDQACRTEHAKGKAPACLHLRARRKLDSRNTCRGSRRYELSPLSADLPAVRRRLLFWGKPWCKPVPAPWQGALCRIRI